jgi:hypothetical protein
MAPVTDALRRRGAHHPLVAETGHAAERVTDVLLRHSTGHADGRVL